MEPICAAILLNGSDTVAAARQKILDSELPHVVIQRIEGRVVFWYILRSENVLADTRPFPGDVAVKDALGLKNYSQAAPVFDLAASTNSGVPAECVVLDGSHFIGIRLGNPNHDTRLSDQAGLVRPPRPRPQFLRRNGRHITSAFNHELSAALRPLGFGAPPLPDLPDDSAPPPQILDTVGANPASESFHAYPRLDAPDVVPPGQRFLMTVGLAERSDSNVTGNPFSLHHPLSVERLRLDLVVVADGFTLPEGAHWTLDIECAAPYSATVQIPLIAPVNIPEIALSILRVHYFFNSSPCGTAARKIAVIPVAIPPLNYIQGNGQLWASGPQASGCVSIQMDGPPIDLTVIISSTDQGNGRYSWSFQSAHPSIPLPSRTISRDYGSYGRELGTQLIQIISDAESQKTVKMTANGLGNTIANRIPEEFWTLLKEVAALVDRTNAGQLPTLLFHCAEPYIPWELATVDFLLDPAAPPFLGCQTNMARWPNYDSGKPSLPNDATMDINQFAVVTGHYADSGQRQLIKAEEEGLTLQTLYKAIGLKARLPAITQLLDVQVPDGNGVQAVHFACHGEAIEDQSINAALILEDNQRMSPLMLCGSDLAKRGPFLFLNACQVGKSGEFMGGPAGFSGQSLLGGFRGFVAPLWSVDDTVAHDIALEFYERAFGDPDHLQPVANILRDLRQPFASDKTSATRLAYVYFGHPALTLKRK